mmetsp:Transcript_11498/g.53463  ORF Transcript_11498/g.53463 Transcript_11498/m.53463 type:complete len:337 (+) Transcript_11498:3810-4820(+)
MTVSDLARAAETVSRRAHGVARLRDLPSEDDFFLLTVDLGLGGSSFMTISSLTIRSYTVSSMAWSMPDPLSAEVAISTKSFLVILVSMFGLCASVLSMMTANARTYAASRSLNTSGLPSQYRAAKASINRSIFCASPGSRNEDMKRRSATSKSSCAKSCDSTNARITATSSSSNPPSNSPIAVLSRPLAVSKNDATCVGSSVFKSGQLSKDINLGLALKPATAASTLALRAFIWWNLLASLSASAASVFSPDEVSFTGVAGSFRSDPPFSFNSSDSPSSPPASPRACHTRSDCTIAKTHCNAPLRTACFGPFPGVIAPASAPNVRSYKFSPFKSQS